jgi:hypothetical protein
MSDPTLIVKYREVRGGSLATWDELFEEAAEFATQIGRVRLIGISHSADESEGVVVVWYWDEPGNVGG